jgi:hypothetical protein
MAKQSVGKSILGLLVIGGLLLYFLGGEKANRGPLPAEPRPVATATAAPAAEVPSVPQAEKDLAAIVDRYARASIPIRRDRSV